MGRSAYPCTLWKNQLTSVIHPQTYCTYNSHRNEVHEVQPDPFGEYEAVYRASLAGCGYVRIIGCTWVIVHATVVAAGGNGSRRDMETLEHRARVPQEVSGISQGRERRYTSNIALNPKIL